MSYTRLPIFLGHWPISFCSSYAFFYCNSFGFVYQMKYDPLREQEEQTYCRKTQKKVNEKRSEEIEETKENLCPLWRAKEPIVLEKTGEKQERGKIIPIDYVFWKHFEIKTHCGNKNEMGYVKERMEDINTLKANGPLEKKPQKKINYLKAIFTLLISFIIFSPSLRFLYSLLDSTKNKGTPMIELFPYIKKYKDKTLKIDSIKKKLPFYSFSFIFNRIHTDEFFLICVNQRLYLVQLINFFARNLLTPSSIFIYSIFFAFYNFTFSTEFVLPPPISIISSFCLYSIGLYFRYIFNGTFSTILLSISFNVTPKTTGKKIDCRFKPLEGFEPTEAYKLWEKKARMENQTISEGKATKMWKQVILKYRSNYTITLCFRIMYTFNYSIFTKCTSFYPTFPFETFINKIKKLQGFALTSLPLFSAPPIFPFFVFFIPFLFFSQFLHIYGQTLFNTISASYYDVLFSPWCGPFFTRKKKTILELQPEKKDKIRKIQENTMCPQEGVWENTQEVKRMEENSRKVEQTSKYLPIEERMKKHKIRFFSIPLIFFNFEKSKLYQQQLKVKNEHHSFVHAFMLTRYSPWVNGSIGLNYLMKQIPPFMYWPSFWISNPFMSISEEVHDSTNMHPPIKNIKKNTRCTQTDKGEHTPTEVFFNFFFTWRRHTPLQMLYKTQVCTETYNNICKKQTKICKNAYININKETKKEEKKTKNIWKKEEEKLISIYSLIASLLTGFAPLLVIVDPNPETGLDPQQVREKEKPMVRKHILRNYFFCSLIIIYNDSYTSKKTQGQGKGPSTFLYVPLYVTYIDCENIYPSTKIFKITLAFRSWNMDNKPMKGFGNTLQNCKKEPVRNTTIYSSYTLFPYFWFFPIIPKEKR